MSKKKEAEEIKEAIENPSEPEEQITLSRRNLLSTGSTLLNLACSGNPFGGFLKGKYYSIVGDSTSGKTFLAMSCFAEAIHNKHFKDYRLIYDNIEDGCLIDIDALFGEKVADRIESPSITKDHVPVHSRLIEEFYYHIDDALKKKQPFIYVLDSMDGLSSESEGDKFEQHKKAHREGKDAPGSYGDGKAKINSAGLRKVINGLRDSGSVLIVLSQTRDSMGGGFSPKTYSGGRAIRFYCTVQFWSSVSNIIRKKIKNKMRDIGNRIRVKFKKNRITGKLYTVEMDIFPSYGIDDIGTCVDYLAEEGWWDKPPKSPIITAHEFGIEGKKEKIIRHIEKNNLENELKSIVGKCWEDIDEACKLKRKKKYSEEEEE